MVNNLILGAYLNVLILRTNAGQFNCHLKPFGCHKPPTVDVKEFTVEDAPVPEVFFKSYVSQEKAAIFRSVVSESDAAQLWTDEYISENFGDMEVRLEAKNETTHLPPKGEKYLGRDNLRHFTGTYHQNQNNVYIVSDLPKPMYKHVGVIPSFGACGEMARRIVEVDIWWSGGGTSSIIHKDEHNQINCLLNGTKYWKLIEPKYEKFLYKHPESDFELGGFSDIDPTAIDLDEFPDVTKIEWSEFTMHSGDCLFLPKGYYHLVSSEGTHNLAVSLLFSRFDGADAIDFSDCEVNIDMKSLRSLADFEVQWQWEGRGTMVMGRQDLEERYRAVFEQYVRTVGGCKINRDGILNMIKEKFTPGDLVMRVGDVNNVFPIVDLNNDGFVTCEEINHLTSNDLIAVAGEIEPYEPSAVYWFEYSVIPFENAWVALNYCMTTYSTFQESVWLKHYVQLGGTSSFGKEIYERLVGGNSTGVKSSEISDDLIWHAMENWVKYWAPQYSNLSKMPTRADSRSLWAAAGTDAIDEDEAMKMNEKVSGATVPSDDYGNLREEL